MATLTVMPPEFSSVSELTPTLTTAGIDRARSTNVSIFDHVSGDGVSLPLQFDGRDDDRLDVVAGTGQQVVHGSHEESAADEQKLGERELQDEQRAARPRPAGDYLVTAAQQQRCVGSGDLHGWDDRADDAGKQREACDNRQRSAVHAGVGQGGEERANGGVHPYRDEDGADDTQRAPARGSRRRGARRPSERSRRAVSGSRSPAAAPRRAAPRARPRWHRRSATRRARRRLATRPCDRPVTAGRVSNWQAVEAPSRAHRFCANGPWLVAVTSDGSLLDRERIADSTDRR